MPHVRMKIEPSHEEIAAVSCDHPDAEFLILDSHTIEGETFVLYEVRTMDPASIIHSFDDVTGLHSYEVLHTGETMVLVRFVIDEPAPSRAARSSGTLLTSPLVLRDGWLFVAFTTSNEALSRFKDELESTAVTHQIVSITPSSDPMDSLTERQREVLEEAVDRGYYETPRECSITDLATDLGVTKGTVSRVLHRAEGTIITQSVTST